MEPLPAILLAAGLSSRMGAFKPLLPLGPANVPLIRHVLQAFEQSEAIAPILIITGHNADRLTAALTQSSVLSPPHSLFHNPNYAAGEMLSSLRIGIDHLPPAVPAFLLAFADQPAVRPATLRQLIHAFHGQKSPPPLVLPTFLGKRGHPVVLSTQLIPEIRALAPSDSLKSVVHRHLDRAHLVPVEDPAILEDLDTPEDFARAQKKYAGVSGVAPDTR